MNKETDRINETSTSPAGTQEFNIFANLAKPAQRALAAAGYSRLGQLTQVSEAKIKHLHGIGPNALSKIRQAMQEKGLSFANPPPN